MFYFPYRRKHLKKFILRWIKLFKSSYKRNKKRKLQSQILLHWFKDDENEGKDPSGKNSTLSRWVQERIWNNMMALNASNFGNVARSRYICNRKKLEKTNQYYLSQSYFRKSKPKIKRISGKNFYSCEIREVNFRISGKENDRVRRIFFYYYYSILLLQWTIFVHQNTNKSNPK